MPRKTERKVQSHQNEFKFKHNKGSKKTKKILSLPTTGLCLKCYEKIQWRKEYRKYKPLKAPKRCVTCKEIKITQAYHVYCKSCANGKCEKCGLDRERDVIGRDEVRIALNERVKELESSMTGIKERERRKIMRELKEEIMNKQGRRRDGEEQDGEDDEDLGEDAEYDGEALSDDDDARDVRDALEADEQGTDEKKERHILLKPREAPVQEQDEDEDSDDSFAGLL